MAVEIGQIAPDFALYDTNRQRRRLGEFHGKNVVLAFFPGAFTGACTHEMCTLRDRTERFSSLNAQVVGISVDPPFAQKAWADQNALKFTVLSDFNREVVRQYDVAWPNLAGMDGYVAANRAVFVLDNGGVVRYKWIAPSPATEPNYEEISQAVERLGK